MDGHTRQNPAYRPAKGKALVKQGFFYGNEISASDRRPGRVSTTGHRKRARLSARGTVTRVNALADNAKGETAAPRLWIPRQHGAWPMLAIPLLLGISVSRFNGWQLAIAGAAASGYLTSATAQTWRLARSCRKYRSTLLVYSSVFVAFSLALAISHPALCLALLVLLPATAVTVSLSRPGRPRGAIEGLAQVVEALVLIPAAAYLAGPLDDSRVALATLAAGLYLAGTVLTVRSVIRERGNSRFAALSVGYHAIAAITALLLLPGAYAVLFVALAVRALALPIAERRLASTAHRLRATEVGMVEIVASVLLVGLCFARPL